MDTSLLHGYYDDYSKRDSARLKSLSSNGSLSWLHVPFNMHYGVTFKNREFNILKNLMLGSKVTHKKNCKCKLCGK